MQLIAAANDKVGSFKIGRYARLEQDEKVREVEASAAHILMYAYRHLETAVLDDEPPRQKTSMEQLWVREAIGGRWFDELRIAADAMRTSVRINGTAEYRLREVSADISAIRAGEPFH